MDKDKNIGRTVSADDVGPSVSGPPEAMEMLLGFPIPKSEPGSYEIVSIDAERNWVLDAEGDTTLEG